MASEKESNEKVNDSFYVEVVTNPDGRKLVRITRGMKTITHLEHTVPSWMLSEE